jgi:penicillin-binding protein 1A
VANNIVNNSLSKSKPGNKKTSSSKKKTGNFSLIKLLFQSGAILFFLAVLFFVLVFIGVFGPVPSKQQLREINNPVASEVFRPMEK